MISSKVDEQLTLRKKIGSGSFSVVYQAFHKKLQKEVAVKIIEKKIAISERQKKFIQDEIKVLISLDHPNIVKCLGVLEDDDYYYIVMELIIGETLLAHINSKSGLTEAEASGLFSQIVRAFLYVHNEMNVIHRDVKLENIMFIPPSTVKIIDFGFARRINDNEEIFSTMCGSLAYSSPEMIRNRMYTKCAEVWSLGVCLYAMVMGQLPFKSESMTKLMDLIVNSQPQFPPNVSMTFKDLCSRMLEKDPNLRIKLSEILSHPWINQNSAINNIKSISSFSCRSFEMLTPMGRKRKTLGGFKAPALSKKHRQSQTIQFYINDLQEQQLLTSTGPIDTINESIHEISRRINSQTDGAQSLTSSDHEGELGCHDDISIRRKKSDFIKMRKRSAKTITDFRHTFIFHHE